MGARPDAALLGEAGVEEAHHRDVQAVEPDDRIAAVVAVVVVRPRRRDDEVAEAHRRPLAVDGRVRAFAVEDEAKRRLRVPVRGRHFAGQDELQAGVDRLRQARLAAQGGVLEHEDAPLGLLGGDEPPGLHDVLAQGGVAEVHRRDRTLRLRRHERAQHLPQRRQAEPVDALVEGAPLGLLRCAAAVVPVHAGILRHGASPVPVAVTRGYNASSAAGAAP